MFKNLILYRTGPLHLADLQGIEQALAKSPFSECGATQEQSGGWVPARGEANGAMVESIGGQWIAKFMTEAKAVPAQVLARRVKEKADRIEIETGRKPGKKESRDLKDEAMIDLLPMAFAKQSSTLVWIDPIDCLLAIDAGTQSRADDVVSALIGVLPGLSAALLHTQSSPQASMAHWLSTHEPPRGFSIDRECELKSCDETKSVVKYGRHPLDTDEISAHIAAGKLPTKLALTWDGRVSFVLTEGLQIKRLEFLDSVFDGRASDDSGFDADVAIATGELARLIPDLIDALGGESVGILPWAEASGQEGAAS